MAAITTGEIKITNSFADDTTRDVKFTGLDPNSDAFKNAKTNIKAFSPAAIATAYLSDGGASYTGITAATLTEITRDPFNLNDSE